MVLLIRDLPSDSRPTTSATTGNFAAAQAVSAEQASAPSSQFASATVNAAVQPSIQEPETRKTISETKTKTAADIGYTPPTGYTVDKIEEVTPGEYNITLKIDPVYLEQSGFTKVGDSTYAGSSLPSVFSSLGKDLGVYNVGGVWRTAAGAPVQKFEIDVAANTVKAIVAQPQQTVQQTEFKPENYAYKSFIYADVGIVNTPETAPPEGPPDMIPISAQILGFSKTINKQSGPVIGYEGFMNADVGIVSSDSKEKIPDRPIHLGEYASLATNIGAGIVAYGESMVGIPVPGDRETTEFQGYTLGKAVPDIVFGATTVSALIDLPKTVGTILRLRKESQLANAFSSLLDDIAKPDIEYVSDSSRAMKMYEAEVAQGGLRSLTTQQAIEGVPGDSRALYIAKDWTDDLTISAVRQPQVNQVRQVTTKMVSSPENYYDDLAKVVRNEAKYVEPPPKPVAETDASKTIAKTIGYSPEDNLASAEKFIVETQQLLAKETVQADELSLSQRVLKDSTFGFPTKAEQIATASAEVASELKQATTIPFTVKSVLDTEVPQTIEPTEISKEEITPTVKVEKRIDTIYQEQPEVSQDAAVPSVDLSDDSPLQEQPLSEDTEIQVTVPVNSETVVPENVIRDIVDQTTVAETKQDYDVVVPVHFIDLSDKSFTTKANKLYRIEFNIGRNRNEAFLHWAKIGRGYEERINRFAELVADVDLSSLSTIRSELFNIYGRPTKSKYTQKEVKGFWVSDIL